MWFCMSASSITSSCWDHPSQSMWTGSRSRKRRRDGKKLSAYLHSRTPVDGCARAQQSSPKGLSSKPLPTSGGTSQGSQLLRWTGKLSCQVQTKKPFISPFCISKDTRVTINSFKNTSSVKSARKCIWDDIAQLKDFYIKLRCII